MLSAAARVGALLLGAAPAQGSPVERDFPEPVAVAADAELAHADDRDASADHAAKAAEDHQRARLHGRVLAFGRRDPIADALVIPKTGAEPARTDARGRFSLGLPAGKHELIVRAPGYSDLKTNVTLTPRQDLEMEYRLEVDLESNRYRTLVRQQRERAVSSTTLRDEEIHNVPGTGGDPLRVVSSLPGVAPLAGFLPYVVVRGAAPGNTGYYLDGTRVPVLFHVAIGPSVIHPYFIEQVDFYPSGAPVRLGRYVSGIVEARTKRPRRDRVHGDVDLRITDTGMLLEIPIDRARLPDCTSKRRFRCKRGQGKGAITLAGRYSYTAGILSLIQSNIRIQYWDYQGRLDHDLGKTTDLTVFAYGSFDEIGEKAQRDPDTGQLVQPDPLLRFHFHRIDSRVRRYLQKNGLATFAVVLGLDQTGLGSIKTNEWRIAPRVDVRRPLNEIVTLGFGIDQEMQFFRLANDLGDINEAATEDLGLLFGERVVSATGLYADVSVKKSILELRPGVRVDIFAQAGPSPYLPQAKSLTYAIGVDPRVLLREQIAERWTLKQAIGLYSQPPSFPIPVPGIENFGFERGLQRNLQGSFGYEFRLADTLEIVQEAYLGRLWNLQDYAVGEASAGRNVNELEDIISQVTGWTYGIETLVRLDPRLRVFGWIAYTLSRSTRNYRLGGNAPSDWDQRHILNVVLGYQVSHKWNFGGRLHFHTGRPWTAIREGETSLQALARHRNDSRLPSFLQFDVRAERIWRWPNWELRFVFDVANATYAREVYQCGQSGGPIDLEAERSRNSCRATGFRYIIPSIGLRARF